MRNRSYGLRHKLAALVLALPGVFGRCCFLFQSCRCSRAKGSSTGISPKALGSFINFIEGELQEITGKPIRLQVDRESADILLLHNAGGFISWPENIEAFAISFEAAGVD